MPYSRDKHIQQGKAAQRNGKIGDDQGVRALGRMGILQLHKIATPYSRVPHPTLRGYYRIIEREKVAGDWRGLLPNGISVLAEMKARFGANLVWSDFEIHQTERLSSHAELALSLVVWLSDAGVSVMRWPIEGFDGPRCSITPAKASLLDIQNQPIKGLMESIMSRNYPLQV
jgi:hypothetical protein